ncbi:MAG: hypothetical protein JXQ71_03940 [Verrucomicrobia bacterium]|nr:hypothetical protein [Verrucomicrobiota bacterium]
MSRAATRERQAARRGAPPFGPHDILDLPSLVAKLATPTEPVAEFLQSRFSEPMRQALASFKPSGGDARAVEQRLLDELNAIAQGDLIYERQRFAAVTFCKDTRILLTQRPRGERLARLNRLLLGDAFPAELRSVARKVDLRQTAYRATRPLAGSGGKRTMPLGKVLVRVAAVLLVLACGLAVARPAYRAYKTWGAKRSEAQATAFMAAGDYRKASLAARKALSMRPTRVEATRIMARLAELSGLPDAIKWRQRLVDLEPAAASNKLDLARTALMLQNPFVAQMSLQNIPEADRNTSEYHQVAAMLEMTKGRLAQAEHHLAEASRIDPDNPLLQLNLAVLHLQSEDAAVVDDAQAKLAALAKEPKTRRSALQHLIQFAVQKKDLARALQLSDELVADPQTTFEDRMLRLSILHEAKAATLEQSLETLRREAEERPERIHALANWMIRHERAGGALEWLLALPEERRQQQPVTMAISDCYIGLQDWAKLEEYLKGKDWEYQEFLRLAVLAGAAAKQNDAAQAKSLWQSAVAEATESLRALQTLVRMAQAWRWHQEREDLLWLIAERFPSEGRALQALEDWYAQRGNTRGLNRLYAHLVSSSLKEVSESLKFVVAKNNLASTLLLLKQQLPRAHELARDVYQVKPDNAAFAATYAYSVHLQGNTAEGIQALETLKPEMLDVPAVAAYYGVLLAANGQADKARKYLELARKGKLLPEELALVEQALQP